MCQPKPGRRCSSHTLAKVERIQDEIRQAETHVKDLWHADNDNSENEFDLDSALLDYPVEATEIASKESELEQARIGYYETEKGYEEGMARYAVLMKDPDRAADVGEGKRLMDLLERGQSRAAVRDALQSRMFVGKNFALYTSEQVFDPGAQQDFEGYLDLHTKDRNTTGAVRQLSFFSGKMHKSIAEVERVQQQNLTSLDQNVQRGYIHPTEIEDWQEQETVLAILRKKKAVIDNRLNEHLRIEEEAKLSKV